MISYQPKDTHSICTFYSLGTIRCHITSKSIGRIVSLSRTRRISSQRALPTGRLHCAFPRCEDFTAWDCCSPPKSQGAVIPWQQRILTFRISSRPMWARTGEFFEGIGQSVEQDARFDGNQSSTKRDVHHEAGWQKREIHDSIRWYRVNENSLKNEPLRQVANTRPLVVLTKKKLKREKV
jgi:hypothetical protein